MNFALLQADLMFETMREWPRYVKVPFPVAKASPSGTTFFCRYFVICAGFG